MTALFYSILFSDRVYLESYPGELSSKLNPSAGILQIYGVKRCQKKDVDHKKKLRTPSGQNLSRNSGQNLTCHYRQKNTHYFFLNTLVMKINSRMRFLNCYLIFISTEFLPYHMEKNTILNRRVLTKLFSDIF